MPRGTKDGSIVRLDRDGHVTTSVRDTVRFLIKKRYTDLKLRPREKKRIAYNATEALRKKRAIEREIADELAGVAKPDRKRTVSDVIAYCKLHQFKPAVYAGDLKIAGQRTWRATWNALKPVEKYFGKMAIMEVTHKDFVDYKEQRLALPVVTRRVDRETNSEYFETRQRSVASVNRELAWARVLFSVALQEGWITDHPFRRGRALIQASFENKHLRILSFTEEPLLFAAFEAEKRGHLPFAVTFAIETGMRKIEQFRNLDRYRDVDIDGRLLWATSYKGNRMIRRAVPITELLLPQLVAHLASSAKQAGPRVFPIDDPKKAFGNACEDAGIEDVTWHTLRHTAITRMVHVYKIPPIDVMQIVGHTNWKTFLGTYVNIGEDMVRSIGAAIDTARAIMMPAPSQYSVEVITEVPQ